MRKQQTYVKIGEQLDLVRSAVCSCLVRAAIKVTYFFLYNSKLPTLFTSCANFSPLCSVQ